MQHVCDTREPTLRPADSLPAEAGTVMRGTALLPSVVAAVILVGLLGTAAVTGLAPPARNDAVAPPGEAPYAGLVNPQAVLHEAAAVPAAPSVQPAPPASAVPEDAAMPAPSPDSAAPVPDNR